MSQSKEKANALLERILKSQDKENLDSKFVDRLTAQFSVIFDYFHQMYPLRGDVWDYLEELVVILIKNFQQRDQSLKKLDQVRIKNPDWFLSEQLMGMMLYTDRWAGNIKGIEQRIDYFQELGVNLVHLMPISKCPEKENDGGYAVSDYRSVNPKLGTMNDLKKLASSLHKKDMHLMIDLVLNHTSDQHEWAEKAKSGDQTYQDYYYFFEDRSIPDQFEQSLPQVFPETAPGNFVYVSEVNKWVMSVFNQYQWDLNYTNPKVFIEMIDVILFLANQGIDILRLDALAFTWKKIGTDSQNLEEAHRLIRALKCCTEIVAPGTLFLAEAIVAPPEIVKYFGEGKESKECDLAYNAALMTVLWDCIATKNKKLLWTAVHNVAQKPYGTTWLNYVRCHDDIGLGYEDYYAEWAGYDPYQHRRFLTDFLTGSLDWSFGRGRRFMEDPHTGTARISGSLASLAGLEKALVENNAQEQQLAIRRINMLHAIIISYGGIPLIYAGDELAMLNDYSFEKDDSKRKDNRWLHRPLMDWNKAEKRYEKGSVEFQVFQNLKDLIKVRKSRPEFADHNNTFMVDCHNDHLFSFERKRGNHRTLMVYNLNDQTEFVKNELLFHMGYHPDQEIYDLVSREKILLNGADYQLDPYQFVWLTNELSI